MVPYENQTNLCALRYRRKRIGGGGGGGGVSVYVKKPYTTVKKPLIWFQLSSCLLFAV